MISRYSRTILLSLICSAALPVWGQNYLYTPQPAATGQHTASGDSILVQEIEVKKGDSLYNLSRKDSGHGMYYPQILLFNKLKKPQLIHPGDIIRIPVGQKDVAGENGGDDTPRTAPAAKKSVAPSAGKPGTAATALPSALPSDLTLHELKAVGVHTTGGDQKKRKPAAARKATPAESGVEPHTTQTPSLHGAKGGTTALSPVATGQKNFEEAVKAYRRDDCRTAIDLLDRYLASNSDSPLAADATLYRADCYLKLSSP